MSRTMGAFGMFINKEFAKNVTRRRASIFCGIFMADSLTVKSKCSLVTYIEGKGQKVNVETLKNDLCD